MWRLRAGVPIAMLSAIGSMVGCSLITNAYDYAVGPQDAGADALDSTTGDAADTGTPDPRACAQCLEHPELAHPPCAPAASSDAGTAQSYFFAVKSIDFGATRATWTSASYSAGLDQDCSDRLPDGVPTGCKSAQSTWVALPHGIDNAFATQVLTRIDENALDSGSVDVQANVNAWLTSGVGGLMLVVDHWNGQPDDDAVGVRLVQSAWPALGGAPRFATDEAWVVYADGVDGEGLPAPSSNDPIAKTAYVNAGTLVADFRDNGSLRIRFGNTSGALMKLDLDKIVMSGALSPSGIEQLAVAGQLGSGGQLFSVERELAQLAIGCSVTQSQLDAVKPLFDNGFDLRVPPKSNCDAMSVGFAMVAPRVGNATPIAGGVSCIEPSCPTSPPPCGGPPAPSDGGAD